MKKNSLNTDKKLYDNFSKTLQEFIRGKRYEPMGQTALLKRLKIPAQFHELCKEIIADLIAEGVIELRKKQITAKKAKPDVIKGTLRMHPRGFGFVIPDHPSECPQDVFIPRHLTDNAVDGDIVEVALAPQTTWEKGPEGRILAVIKRGRTHLAGTVRHIDTQGNIIVHVPLLGSTKLVIVQVNEEDNLRIGDRIIMKVHEWGDEQDATICELSHKIGHISDPSCDVAAAVEEFDIRHLFPKEAVAQAKKAGKSVTKKDQKGREDLTGLNTFTIDPETARDFDDALSLTKDRKGNYQLTVHIADAAHYVGAGTPLDKEASERCNSTYFPGTCVPMLPEELSNELCSLKADVIRLTISVQMNFDKEGTLLNHKIMRAYIKSAKRFTYEEAKLVLDGEKKSPHLATLKLMVELCHLLKKKRAERGSIDFSLPDLVIEVDEKGIPKGVRSVEYDITHQLVEEFMLKANEVVAKALADRGKGVIYRIHEEPSPENFQDFFNLARSLGFALPEKPTLQELQQLFDKAKATPYGQQLSVGFIRSMKLAYYSPDNVGHYGLALQHYCHFTSPIRRYSDLITQRLLFDEEGESIHIDKIALRCSEQERISFRAETSVKVLKKLRLMKEYYKEDPAREYRAVITRVKPFGLFFELPELMLEGFLHISELENDYFVYDQRKNALIGRERGIQHTVGKPLAVSLLAVDFILLETKWALVSSNKRPQHPQRPQRQGHFRRRRR